MIKYLIDDSDIPEQDLTHKQDTNPYNVEMIPVMTLDKFNNYLSDKKDDYKFLGPHLTKGKYDINYVINLLRIIEDKCEEMKMNPKDLSFTLRESCKRLIAMLEVERSQQQSD